MVHKIIQQSEAVAGQQFPWGIGQLLRGTRMQRLSLLDSSIVTNVPERVSVDKPVFGAGCGQRNRGLQRTLWRSRTPHNCAVSAVSDHLLQHFHPLL